ncbi:MAG TPA: barstar family protein [Candidatus Saccharimonadia bacterium]
MVDEIVHNNEPFTLVRSRERDVDLLIHDARSDPSTFARIIRGHRSVTLKSFMQEAAAAFQFPYYFGENWSAYDDCINDASWLLNHFDSPPLEKIVIAITNVNEFLRDEEPDQLQTFYHFMERARQEWRSGNNDISVRTKRVSNGRKVNFTTILHLEPNTNTPDSIDRLLTDGRLKQINIRPLDSPKRA